MLCFYILYKVTPKKTERRSRITSYIGQGPGNDFFTGGAEIYIRIYRPVGRNFKGVPPRTLGSFCKFGLEIMQSGAYLGRKFDNT